MKVLPEVNFRNIDPHPHAIINIIDFIRTCEYTTREVVDLKDFLSVAEAAQHFGISSRRVQLLCEQGRIGDAKMVSGVWIIPATAQKPKDGRRKASIDIRQISFDELVVKEEAQLLTFDEMCAMLSVSGATGRNWVKLGKIVPQQKNGRSLMFARDDIEKILQKIANGDSNALSRRRNKKKISGFSAYESYISSRHNIDLVNRIITQYGEDMTPSILRSILANIALQFICRKNGNTSANVVSAYLHGDLPIGSLSALIDDLLGDKNEILATIDLNADAYSERAEYVAAEDTLGFIYISLVCIGERKASGAYYTPLAVVHKLVSHLADTTSISGKSIFDPCCGSGNFLLAIGEYTATPELIYGQDIDMTAVQLARISFALRYGIDDIGFLRDHFTCNDTYDTTPRKKFSVILGNPPWGGELPKERLALLTSQYRTVSKNGTETYDLFIERALSLLAENGKMAYVLPEALLNVAAHSIARQMLIGNCNFKFVQYLGNVFGGVQCPSIILEVEKSNERVSGVESVCLDKSNETYSIRSNRQISGERFNFHVRDEIQDCIDAITTLANYKTLADSAKFALGIVTGDNANYISGVCHEGYEPVLKGNDVKKYRLHDSSNYIRFVPQSFQQVAPIDLYRAPEKLLYRFICESLVFAYDDHQTLSLNSCNIVIPLIPSMNAKYILAIMNSRVANFFFVNMFNSIKILRSHIEAIPIPTATSSEQAHIVSLVDKMSCSKGSITKMYDELDDIIMSLYKLNSSEMHTIAAAMSGRNLFLD